MLGILFFEFVYLYWDQAHKASGSRWLTISYRTCDACSVLRWMVIAYHHLQTYNYTVGHRCMTSMFLFTKHSPNGKCFQKWHLSIFGQTPCPKNNKGLCTCGDKNIKRWQQKQQHNNHNFKCLYSMFANHHICVVLWSSVHHIGDWNSPKSRINPNILES